MPKRLSLPSRLILLLAPSCMKWLLPFHSAHITSATQTTKINDIAHSSVRPWRRSLTTSPKAKQSAAGIRKIASICTKLVNAVGFSNGCDELALKKPPPLVPSILIASCDATGPIGRSSLAPSSEV
ncbi:Uncharacterised protein [Enterobacter cloacae]|nr:Uncharacterised protein [Enterobacter cloacae]